MALSISDRCLPSPSVGQRVNNVPQIPVLVPNFLQDLWWRIKQTKRHKTYYSVIIFYNINNIWMKRPKLESTELECSIMWVVLSWIWTHTVWPQHLRANWISWGRIHEFLNRKWQADPLGGSFFCCSVKLRSELHLSVNLGQNSMYQAQ